MAIALHRGHKHGDVLCLTSAIPGISNKYMEHIDFYVDEGYDQLILHDPRIRHIHVGRPDPSMYSHVFSPDHGKEWNDAICKVQCKMIGVPFSPPRYYITEEELSKAPHHQIAICAHSSAQTRDSHGLFESINHLAQKYDCVQVDNGKNICYQPKTSLREAAAIIAKADLTISVDTSLMHVAAALGVNALFLFVGLTGPHNQWINNADYLIRPSASSIIKKVESYTW